MARTQGFNRPQVKKKFDVLERAVAENNITFDRIYNVDDSALSTVQRPQKIKKIMASKGRKQVGATTRCRTGGTHYCSLRHESNR